MGSASRKHRRITADDLVSMRDAAAKQEEIAQRQLRDKWYKHVRKQALAKYKDICAHPLQHTRYDSIFVTKEHGEEWMNIGAVEDFNRRGLIPLKLCRIMSEEGKYDIECNHFYFDLTPSVAQPESRSQPQHQLQH